MPGRSRSSRSSCAASATASDVSEPEFTESLGFRTLGVQGDAFVIELAVEPHNGDAARYLEECSRKRARDEATLPSSIRHERNVNPFLRCDQQTVKQAAEHKAGRRLQNTTEVFAVIRQWKDGFRA